MHLDGINRYQIRSRSVILDCQIHSSQDSSLISAKSVIRFEDSPDWVLTIKCKNFHPTEFALTKFNRPEDELLSTCFYKGVGGSTAQEKPWDLMLASCNF